MTGRKGRFSYAVDEAKKAQPERIEVLSENKQKAKKTTPAKQAVPSVKPAPADLAPTPDLTTAAEQALHNPAAFALPPQRRGWRGAKPGQEVVVKRMDVPREQLNVRVRPELKRAAAARAALNGLTLGDVVEAALIAYLESAKK